MCAGGSARTHVAARRIGSRPRSSAQVWPIRILRLAKLFSPDDSALDGPGERRTRSDSAAPNPIVLTSAAGPLVSARSSDSARQLATRRKKRAAPPPSGALAQPVGFGQVRISVEDPADGLVASVAGDALCKAAGPASPTLRILALSGGGAGGAFGAGALVGLTQAGSRPTFDIVTGVSTGALIAPFAFLGSEWDDALADAYTGSSASEALALTGLRPGLGLYPADRLAGLVRRYVSEALLQGVAEAHGQGRRLLVATANLDAQATSIWDMGAIASHGGAAALKLFEDVLVASASLPGVFPPKLIEVSTEDGVFEEMHVDGGAISPLFVVPDPRLLQRARAWKRPKAEVYALVNTTLHPRSISTPLGALPVLVRSFELMLRSTYRSALRSVAGFCESNGLTLNTACIPSDFDGASMLRFERPLMLRLFDHGADLARQGRLWRQMGA